MKGAACLAQHHSADTLRSDYGSPCSPGFPNRANQDGTSRFGLAQIVLPAQTIWEAYPAWRNGTTTPDEACLPGRQCGGQNAAAKPEATIQTEFAQKKVQVHAGVTSRTFQIR
jgi:hypothetical protein